MKRSIHRILTTHTGSLPRPPELIEMLAASEAGKFEDRSAFENKLADSVSQVIHRQLDTGIDVINDGEMGKISYATYVKDRLEGFGGESISTFEMADIRDYPEYGQRLFKDFDVRRIKQPSCDGPIRYRNSRAVERDIDNIKSATAAGTPEEIFMTAASPGVIALFLENKHYSSREEYLAALADAMKEEYDAIYRAGFLLQLDCPDLAMGRSLRYPDIDLKQFLRIARENLEALNHATRDIPPGRMRMHVCWGNYESPHNHDIPLEEVIGVVLHGRPSAVSIEASNPRHGHEWTVFQRVRLPDDKLLMPGMIDTTTNYIEHPELVAQRILAYTRVVGKENVIACTDCGFATFAEYSPVEPRIAWAKLRSLVEGAQIASQQLW